MDPLSIVADEVALEGLDGITLPSLWIRLEGRQPKFPLKLDDSTKELIWKSLIHNTDLKFYQLPHEREDVELFDRFKHIDPETGIETRQKFSDSRKDVYPISMVQNKEGIQGSCALFKQRKDVTKNVRSESLTPIVNLQEAFERYGRKLVVVASQTLRFRTLIGSESDPDLKLSDDSYCVLERVGRARWQGELQRDLHGCSFKIDARKLHYMRKALVRHGLIGMQSHCTRVTSGQQQHSILLMLKRFYVNRRSKYDILMEKVSNYLQHCPGQLTSFMVLRECINVNERSFKRVLQYMRSAKLVDFIQHPLEELDPSAGPCTNKKGDKVLIRCVKLLKPYSGKSVADEDDDEDDEEEYDNEARRSAVPSQGRIMEIDVMSQAYHIVLSCGTRGIPKTAVGLRMNVGKLESRMLCRRMEKDGIIKGFMEDVGRQRTTKYISHKCVGVSDQLQLFAKEQERKKLLYSSAPRTSDSAPVTPKTPSTSKKAAKKTPAAKKTRKAGRGGSKDAEEAGQTCDDRDVDPADDVLDGDKGQGRSSGAKRNTARRKSRSKQTQPETPIVQPAPDECETPACSNDTTPDSESESKAEQAVNGEKSEITSSPASPLPQREAGDEDGDTAQNNVVEVRDNSQLTPRCKKFLDQSHETYRLLRRKNLIVEAVRNFRIIEGLFPLQKMINDEEKQDGFSSKCCKKTILRLVHRLSREGLLKLYNTTIIQDGITKKVEMVVHPSIQPNDEAVTRVIEQVRFRISSSYSAVRLQQEQDERMKKDNKKKDKDDEFKPETVRGLGRSLGFQPKMPRLRLIHNFLWYLIYGHPHRQNSSDSNSTSQTAATSPGSSDPADGPVDPRTADSTSPNLDVASSGDEEEELKEESIPRPAESNLKVFADEDSWKRFVPPVRVHKDFGGGWAMIGDLLLCLPLSVFVQITQINYKVDGLEEYLNDPVKQHYLVRTLPAKMKRQLLYRRKYIFIFHENLQKLVYMGLLQFGPVEKFKEKDQVFLYLKRNSTIVDTTQAEPHYWLVTESPDKPFEKRQYTFNTAEDVENYWFDLMCVCLNTPLGVIRSKRNVTEEEADPSFVHDRNVFIGLAYLLKGSREVSDDGSIPGDGKGAGGLDSEFFGHLKRNWFWTNHLLSCKRLPTGLEAKENKIRLKSLLSKNALRMALTAAGSATRRYLTTKRPFKEIVEVDVEPATRNQQVVGGKGQKRKRSKKEVVKAPRKKRKEPKKRTPAHDEADHKALKMMTRQRVYWSIQEDSLMMLCSVASHLLNNKLKRPFIPYCGVRDLLHAEFEMSVDKTSVAVGRRTRYILKNPQTLLNYRICLAEVHQDKPLMSVLEEKKPEDPDNPEDCAKVFSEYVQLLRQKFSTALSPGDLTVPDTKQQLFSRFRVAAIDCNSQMPNKDTLNCTEEIHALVLENLIQSTLVMTNSQMKSSRSFQTFQLYSKYNQELLCKVFIQCRKRGLVNRRRVHQPLGPKKNRALPILPMSYQLSQSYYRCFSTRFPHPLCTDSFRFLRSLINSRTADDKPVTAFHQETEYRSEDGEEVAERRTGSERKRKQSEGKEGGRSVSEPEARPEKTNGDAANEGANDQMNVNGEQTPGQRNSEDCSIVEAAERPSSSEQTDDHLSKTAASVAAPRASAEPPDVTDMLGFSLDSPGGACVVSLSLMTLGLLSVYISIPKQIVVVDSSMVKNDVVKNMAALEEEDDDDDDGEEFEGKKGLEVKAHQASHTNYLMMRGYCSPGIVKRRNLNTLDNIVVESCIMRLQLRNKPAHHLFTLEVDSPPLDLTKCGPSLLPSSLTKTTPPPCPSPSSVKQCDWRLIQQRGYTPQDIKACAQLRSSLDAAGENGLAVQELSETHAHLKEPQSGRSRSLQEYMKDLKEEGQVLQVGSLGPRWVLAQHAEPWLLTVTSKPWSQSCVPLDKLKGQHNIFSMRKRSRREAPQETEEPPAKKSAAEKREGEEKEKATSGKPRKKVDKEPRKTQEERTDEGSKDKSVNVEEEGGKQTLPEEGGEKKGGQEKVEAEKKGRGKEKELRAREDGVDEERDEASSPPAEPDGDDEESVSFIGRPWRMVDGSVNRPVCKGMLEAVLYNIMSRPGLTQRTLVETYKDVLQPMALLDLVQALIDMGCVTKKTGVRAPKASLFSRPVPQARSETTAKPEEPDTVYYEPTIGCCLRLCQVLPNERHWNYHLP